MRHLVAILLFIAIAPALHAQVLIGGFRVGPTAYLEANRGRTRAPFAYQQGAITPELFARYSGKSCWAFEVFLAVPTSLSYEERVTASGMSWEHGLQETKSHYYELGLSAQYEIACRHAGKGAKQSRFHYYMGASAIGVYINDRSEVYEIGNPETSVMSIVTNDYQIWAGLNHTLTYQLTSQWTLWATGDGRLNLNNLIGFGYRFFGDDPVASAGFRVGAAYSIWRKAGSVPRRKIISRTSD